jgi:hypothetical protein
MFTNRELIPSSWLTLCVRRVPDSLRGGALVVDDVVDLVLSLVRYSQATAMKVLVLP